MTRIVRGLIFLYLAACLARGATIHNYKSDIDLTLSGTAGTDYAIEQFHWDPLINDRKVIYIKGATSIGLIHNARNVAGVMTYNIPCADPATAWTGTFTAGETATQDVSGAHIVVLGPQSFGDRLAGLGDVVGVPNQNSLWRGGSSGATFASSNGGTQWEYGIIGATDAYATIRYRVDRDFQWLYEFAVGDGSGTELPPYSSAFTFASLEYSAGVPVVGTTGASTGTALSAANASTYFWRGIVDPYGDEWHTITVADDDSTNPDIPALSFEHWASGGRVFLFVVNPKTPCFSFALTGNAKAYTTPPKMYFVPKVVAQTTYIAAGSGTVTITLHDINGNNVFWRIGGSGSFTDAGSSTKTFTASDFASGSNTLEYYYAGNVAYTKTRIVVKNPAFPSASETHGNIFNGTKTWATILATIADTNTAAYTWFHLANEQIFYVYRAYMDTHFLRGERYGYTCSGYSLNNAAFNGIAAMVYGWDTTAERGTHSYGWYLKSGILDNPMSMDNVGLEKNQVGLTGSGNYKAALGSRENLIRGYFNSRAIADMMLGYDLLVANYTTVQNANGIDALDDLYIRDCIAQAISEAIFNSNLSATDGFNTSGGMWSTAMNNSALAGCYVIPTYSREVFGTCGLDGQTTSWTYCPFPVDHYTWKEVLIDNNKTLTTFPNLNRRFGIEEYMILSDGNMGSGVKASYFNFQLMGQALAVGVNVSKINTPSRLWPNYDLYLVNAATGTLNSPSQPEGNFQFTLPTNYNSRFPLSAATGIAWTATQAVGPETSGATMPSSQSFGLMWWDDPLLGTAGGITLIGKLTLSGKGTIN